MTAQKIQKSMQRHLDMLTTAFGANIMVFMQNPDIIEIMLNPDGKLWVESLTKGKFFTGDIIPSQQAEDIIKLVAAYRHIIVDKDNPEVACELPKNGARFQGWLSPITSSATFTIRKKAIKIFSLADYVTSGSLSAKQAEMLSTAVKERKNILIAGGAASGKTTFANALLHELKDSQERIVVLEDLPELQISIADCVKLRTSHNVSMRNLVKGVLRMRPDRIIIGEIRDGAALELLKAWNTGHPGGVCTIHANNPEATLARLEDLVHEVVNVVPQRLINEAIDLIVFMQRDNKGRYKITKISDFNNIAQ